MEDMEKKIKDLQVRLNELIETSKKILKIIDNTLKIDDECFDSYEADASRIAWYYYATLYIKSTPPEDTKFNFYNKFTSGKHKALPYHKDAARITLYLDTNLSILHTHNDTDVNFSGDCCFNFKSSKTNTLSKIIETETDSTLKGEAKLLLSIATKMHHSPLNFALMPRSGGMNDVKGDSKHGLDRFDVFLSALYLFYENIENPTAIKLIANFETSCNSLIPFLNSIGSFKNYCQLFYPELLSDFSKDNKLLEKLIKSGKKPIKIYDNNGKVDTEATIKRVIEYIKLAILFWESKANYYEDQIEQKNNATE